MKGWTISPFLVFGNVEEIATQVTYTNIVESGNHDKHIVDAMTFFSRKMKSWLQWKEMVKKYLVKALVKERKILNLRKAHF